jgi:large subunit ribosomal protein L7/L12
LLKVKNNYKESKMTEEVKTTEEVNEVNPKFADLIKKIEELSALELSELVKALEDRFGVSAAAPVAAVGAAAPAAAEAEEEKANYNVVLTNGGSNKIGAIKAVREISPDLSLGDAKELVENPPKAVKENVPTEEAKAMKEKLEAAGATVELQ